MNFTTMKTRKKKNVSVQRGTDHKEDEESKWHHSIQRSMEARRQLEASEAFKILTNTISHQELCSQPKY